MKTIVNYHKLATAVMLALAPTSWVMAQDQVAESKNAQDDIEVIQVSGFRGSLNVALMSKREAVGSKETILAEDLGKFPDLNVADSLARVPGIAIEQDAGEGRQISLRGLGSTFVKTTINGMESASAGAATDAAGGSNKSRAFDFNVFASELFTQIDINKTVSAELEDGGISGNVNLQTARPFQYQDTKFAYNLNGRYNDVADEVTPRASLMFSKNWDNRFGVLLSAAYSEGLVQSEGGTTGRWSLNHPAWAKDDPNNKLTAKPVTQLSPNGVYTNENMEGIWIPRIPRYSIFNKQQDRLGVTAAFQFRPVDDLLLNVDILHAKLDSTMDEFQYSALLRNNVSSKTNVYAQNLVVDSNNTLVAATLSGVPLRSEARQDVSSSDFTQLTFSADWQPSDALNISFLAGVGKSDLDIPYQRTFALDSFDSTFAYSFDSSIDPVALISQQGSDLSAGRLNLDIPSFAFAPGQAFGADYSKAELQQLMLNPDLYSLGLVRNRNQQINSKNTNLTLDFAYDINDSLVLKWGLNHRVFSTANVQRDTSWKALNMDTNKTSGPASEEWVQALDESRTAGALYALTLAQAGQYFGNAANVPGSSALSSASWLTPDYQKVLAAFSDETFFTAKERFNSTYDIEEKVTGVYLQLDFRTELFDRELRGNIGGRYLDNSNTSGIINLDHVYADGYTAGRGEGANFASGYGWRYTNSSGKDFLPSLNLAYDLTDDIVGRFSMAKAITRPALSDLASAIKVNQPDSNDPTATMQLGAGPTLRPYESDQVDVALEWYFDEESLLAISVFYKDITGLSKGSSQEVLSAAQLAQLGIDLGDIDPATVTWDVTQLLNTPAESVLGIEFIYQQPFNFLPEPFNRFGVQTNYTWIDYERDIEDPLTGQVSSLLAEETSQTSYNATLYFEHDNFSARFSYNFREGYIKEYLNKYKDEGAFGRGYDDKAQLNFSSRYKISDTLSVSFEAINLTNAASTQWSDVYSPRPYEYLLTGRQFLLGVRGTF
ncbi:TonB-dependent receptor [Rheinheimera baltica]|uniref:TonB-dependent receptor n=1 Tax=Rheinheimera baltica TaxID=67576 RepID=A0ABT9I2W0_9GAMM|nr:TonB-dependent receptor [Rheinheimera baltica]MDP5137720.1 TonB-dependent receptor [Rheinheimera baltica]MDP5150123.1 TonB-dependent receptor [Rheinheimera baltica]